MSTALAEALRAAAEAAENIAKRGPDRHEFLEDVLPVRLEMAIRRAWDRADVRRGQWQPMPGIDYPEWHGSKSAWPSSEFAIAPVVHLPPGEILISSPVYLPQNVSLVGPSFASCNMRFTESGCLRVLGNLRPDEGTNEGVPFQQLRGQISGVKFVAGDVEPIQLYGDLANWRFTNNHLMGTGLRDKAGIQHVNAYNEDTPFGRILTADKGGHTLKEVDITDNQIEGFSASISISGAVNCRIHGNKSIYANLGVEARNCSELMITGNSFKGAKPGEDIQPGDQAGIIGSGKAVAIHSNLFSHLDAAVFWRGPDNHFQAFWFANSIFGCPRGRGHDSRIDGRWRADKNWGPFQKGAKPPYAID